MGGAMDRAIDWIFEDMKPMDEAHFLGDRLAGSPAEAGRGTRPDYRCGNQALLVGAQAFEISYGLIVR